MDEKTLAKKMIEEYTRTYQNVAGEEIAVEYICGCNHLVYIYGSELACSRVLRKGLILFNNTFRAEDRRLDMDYSKNLRSWYVSFSWKNTL